MVSSWLAYAQAARFARLEDIIDRRPDKSVGVQEIQRMQVAMQRYGYVLEKSLGTIKGHQIYAVAPDPNLVVRYHRSAQAID